MNDLNEALNDAPLTVRFERRVDTGLFGWGQNGGFVIDRFDDVAAGWQVTEFSWKIPAVPRHDSCYSTRSIGRVLSRFTVIDDGDAIDVKWLASQR